MSTFDKQAAFDKAAKGVLAQGKRSLNAEETRCAYRGKGGSKCAVGHLIPDAAYDPIMDARGYIGDHTDNSARILAAIGATEADVPFLGDMQRAHDNLALYTGSFRQNFAEAMRDVATRHGLSSAVLDA